jgi:transposase
MIVLEPHGRSSKEVPVSIVGGFDVHRRQITFDWVDRATGQAQRGQITPATAEGLGRWLAQLPCRGGAFAVEACTGWRFVVQELQAAGWHAYLAEPAETASLRGPKRRAKTDRTDAQLLRELLEQQRLPQAWIPPAHLLELRVLVRLRKTLVDERTAWQQRLHAVLFHHGLPCPDHALLTRATRGWLEQVTLPQASRLQVATALRQIDQLDLELDPLERWLRQFARRQPGCRALIASHYGIGMLIAPTILAELGDARRFANGDAVVRHTGLDVTVYSSDSKRSPGHLSRQGPQVLRWALFAAAHRIRPPHLSRPRPLHPGQGPGGRQPRRPDGGPQARPPGAPYPDRARRRRPRSGPRPAPARSGLTGTMSMRALPTAPQMCRGLRPHRACRHGPAAGGLQRLRGRAHPVSHPASCRRTCPVAGSSTQIRLGAGTHTPPLSRSQNPGR